MLMGLIYNLIGLKWDTNCPLYLINLFLTKRNGDENAIKIGLLKTVFK